MQKLLRNPLVIGSSVGVLAVIIHYINTKLIKKKEKVDITETVKIFIIMSVLSGGSMWALNKKNLLKGKMIGGSVQSVSVSVVPEPVQVPTPVPVNRGVPTQLRSNTVSSNHGLEISDINDVIHTGTPNF